MRSPPIRDPALVSRPLRILAFVSALLLVALDASAQIDLTGRWRVEEGTPDIFADIVQTGTSVTVVWTQDRGFPPEFALIDLSGTFDQTTLQASQTIMGIPDAWLLSMQAYDSGNVLDGTLRDISGTPNHVYFTRCECYDGNEIDGDGCSALCRVEPCFSCTAEPSVCTPSPDAAACDDGNDCTSGETCSAGTCAGGAALNQCVNLDGLWHATNSTGFGEFEYDVRVRQRNGVFTFYEVSSGPGDLPYSAGTVDTATGEMSRFVAGSGFPPFLCPGVTWVGAASLDNLTFSENGIVFGIVPTGCIGFAATTQAVRFATPSTPALTSWGRIAALLALALLALAFLWRAEDTARPNA